MKCTGVAIFDIENKNPILITSIETNDKQTHGERLHIIREFFIDLIHKYPPHEVAIERGFSRFNTSTQVVFRVHGIINELLYETPQTYYAPKTIKEVITKRGDATKKTVQSKILKEYPNIEFANEDESDAFSISLTHLIKKHKMKWN